MNNSEKTQMILGFSLQGYNQMIELAGYKWLDVSFVADSHLKSAHIVSKRFWEWWNNEWIIRDGEYLRETSLTYINEPLSGEELSIALEFFVEKHMVNKITCFPNKWVREEVLALMKVQQNVTKSLTPKK